MKAGHSMKRALMIWVLIGLFSFAALPWYFLQQGSVL